MGPKMLGVSIVVVLLGTSLGLPSSDVQSKTDIQCKFCEKVVQHWLDIYAANSSLEEFNALLDGVCAQLDRSNVAHCKRIVAKYDILFFQFLNKEIDPRTVCASVNLCVFIEDDTVESGVVFLKQSLEANSQSVVNQVELAVSDSRCAKCNDDMSKTVSIIEDKKEQMMIKNLLGMLCHKLPLNTEHKHHCKQFIEGYTESVLNVITTGLKPHEFCKTLQLCSTKEMETPKPLQAIGSSANQRPPSCWLCEYAVNVLYQITKDKTNKAEIDANLQIVCSRLNVPSDNEAQCEIFMKHYRRTITDMVFNKMTPDQICQKVRSCPQASLSTTNLQYQALGDQSKESQIEAALVKVCFHQILPKAIRAQCKTFMTQYKKEVVGMMAKNASPDKICKAIGSCVEVSNTNKMWQQPPTCFICEYIINTVYEMVRVQASLETVCSYAPKNLTNPCNFFLEDYKEILTDMLNKDLTTDQVCQNLGLCLPGDAQQKCLTCRYVVNTVDRMLQIEATMGMVCSYMPKSIRTKCNVFIADYTDSIMDMVVRKLTPDQICKTVGSCTKEVETGVKTFEEISMSKSKPPYCFICEYVINTVYHLLENKIYAPNPQAILVKMNTREPPCCWQCEWIVNTVDQMLDNKSNKNQIEAALAFVCNSMPNSVRAQCNTFMKDYKTTVEGMILSHLNPDQICIGIGSCPQDSDDPDPEDPDDKIHDILSF